MLLGFKVLRAVKVHKVNLDLRDLKEPKDLQDPAVLMVLKERLEIKDPLEKMDPQELMGRMVYLVSLE